LGARSINWVHIFPWIIIWIISYKLHIISLLTGVGRASHQYRGGHGFESRWSPDFFRLLLSHCLNWKINCDDHSSLSFFFSGNQTTDLTHFKTQEILHLPDHFGLLHSITFGQKLCVRVMWAHLL